MRIFGGQAITNAATAEGVPPAKAAKVLAGVSDADIAGMVAWLGTPGAMTGMDEAGFRAAFAAIVGLPDKDTRILMRIIAAIGGGVVL